ncbi:hypothetical protein KC330_g8370 [Hortaea werneckii]|nr:hypothetical protein KC330_g8370 [Hortaea werneckii]
MQILSYAEHYGCSDRILPAFRKLVLEEGESLWMGVAQQPDFYYQFAVKLQNTELYCNALPQNTSKFQPGLNELDAVLGRLERDLQKLQLQAHHVCFSSQGATARTTFLNFLSRQGERRPQRTDNAHLRERSEFLARSLWGQWLVQQLHEEYV